MTNDTLGYIPMDAARKLKGKIIPALVWLDNSTYCILPVERKKERAQQAIYLALDSSHDKFFLD